MELLVFGHAGTPVVVFPASMGRFFDCENRGMIDAVAGKYENGGLQALCVPFVRSRNASPQFPPDFPPNLHDPWFPDRYRRMKIVLATGATDVCLHGNLRMSEILSASGLPQVLDVRAARAATGRGGGR